jgi:hypothetical protein
MFCCGLATDVTSTKCDGRLQESVTRGGPVSDLISVP